MDTARNWHARPLIPLLLSLIAGIASGAHFPGMHWLAVVISVATAAGIVYSFLCRKASRLLPLILFAGLGYLSILPWSAPHFPEHHIVHHTDGPRWRIVGIVHNRPQQRVQRTRFILRVQHIRRLADGQTLRPASGLLRVTAAGAVFDLNRGDRIALTSRIRSIRNFHNPGAFDFRRYMAFQKIWATAYTSAEGLRVLDRATATGAVGVLDAVRDRIDALIERTRQGPHRDVLRALILGDRSRISTDLRQAFHRSGIGHLLAISGLHIGTVAGSAFFILVALASRVEFLLWRGWVKKAAAIGAFLPALAYALIAGMSPSTQRALAMVGMFLLTFLLEREQDALNTLAVAAMLILLFDPPALFSISFQLSFIAVFFIIFGLSRFQSAGGMPTEHLVHRLRRKLLVFIFVTMAATLGTLPLVMTVFQQVSLVGVLANCLFVPLIGFIVVPLGLFAVPAVWVCPPVAAGCMQLAGWLLHFAIEGIAFFAALPFAAVDTFIPSLFETVCYYLLLAAVLGMIRPSRGIDTGHGPARPADSAGAADKQKTGTWLLAGPHRHLRWMTVVALLAIIGALADTAYWIHRRYLHSDLRVTVVDVGQGSAALLELPGGICALADGGGFPNNAVFDVGARVLAPLLRRKKILTVDTLILTHPNSDHLNGLIYIAERFGVQQIWSNGETRDTLGYHRLQEVLDRRAIHNIPYAQLPREQFVAGTRIQMLYPPVDFLERRKAEPWRDTNANSLVFKVGLGSVSFLFTGDITTRAEKEMVSAAGKRLEATVLIVPHHGSRTSSSQEFIEAVGPQIGVVSCGWQNRFGFPHPQVLQRYWQQQVRIYQTDRSGAIELMTDGRQLKVAPWIDR